MTTATVTHKCGLYDCTGLVEPLVTQFIQPPDCIQGVYRVESLATSTTCYPPDFVSVWGGYGYYSPGICPDGYSAACTVTSDASISDYSILPDESAYWCVPSEWDCGDGRWATTTSPADQVPAVQIRWKESDIPDLQTHPVGTDHTTPPPPRTTSAAAATSSSLSISDSGTSSTSQLTSLTDNPGATPASQATSTSTSGPVGSPPDKHSTLSTGAKAGIAIGSILSVLFLGIFIAWLLRRRRRRAPNSALEEPDAENLDGRPISELDSKKRPLSELEDKRPVSELQGLAPIPELDGSEGLRQQAVIHEEGFEGLAELEGDPLEMVANMNDEDADGPVDGGNMSEVPEGTEVATQPTVEEIEFDPYLEIQDDEDQLRERERTLQALSGSRT